MRPLKTKGIIYRPFDIAVINIRFFQTSGLDFSFLKIQTIAFIYLRSPEVSGYWINDEDST